MKSFKCKADVGFLIDGSGSVVSNETCGFVNWRFALNFIVILAQSLHLSSKDARVAVTQFSSQSNFTRINNTLLNVTEYGLVRPEIQFSDHTALQGFIDVVDNLITQHINGGTPTILGLNFSLNEMFQERNGMRPDFREFPKTLVFMTDGICTNCRNDTNINNCVNIPDCSPANFRLLRQQYRARRIRTIGIGLGAGVNSTEILSFVERKNYRFFSNFRDLYDPGVPLKLGLCDGMLIIEFSDMIK